jgi:hypothetical protein
VPFLPNLLANGSRNRTEQFLFLDFTFYMFVTVSDGDSSSVDSRFYVFVSCVKCRQCLQMLVAPDDNA